MSPYLDLYINDVLHGTFTVFWPTVEFKWEWIEEIKNSKFGFGCSDNACNYVMEELNGSDIKTCSINHFNNNQKSYILLFQRVLGHFPIIFSIFKDYFSKNVASF